ncbi:MAG TPA: type III-A CRISPR-associated RAMP protein Csm5, partial [Methanosarcinales archaeon]|nr:type III-A CRISPR-associated RAMP protein Csm5 [Methanosarcinales archaeon]
MKHKYNLEILTPVHIGTGEKIGSVEYVLDKGLHRIDMNELFKDSTFKVQTFINFSENRNCYLGEFNKELALKYTLYYVAIDSKIESELLNQIKNNRSADINEFKKNVFNQPYIPGSSMKGAIRTAI